MKKALILIAVIALGAFGAYMVYYKAMQYKATSAVLTKTEYPTWLETDSAEAIERRTAEDFPLSRAEVTEAIRHRHPEVNDAMLDTFIARHYLETITINGEQRFHRKSARNLDLLNPQYTKLNTRDNGRDKKRVEYVDSIINFYRGVNNDGLSHKVTYRFFIDVPGHDAIAGDTLRVWMPVPLNDPGRLRQRNVRILSTTPESYVLSDGRSVHNSIFFSALAPAVGDTAHFEYTGEFITSGQYYPSDEIEAKIKPYDKENELYLRYTKFEAPHIVRLDSRASAIVGNESNPFRQSEMVYDYIDENFPWAGAREYSTIECIPYYVLTERHGDCGQVSLLYISLMRTLGIPARWESGWMLHPGEVNLHDWAEVYFEGIGWVPVDVSFGRYKEANDPETVNFYSHGIDSFRFASNNGVGGDLFPAKRYVRSETVDFQVGEVETTKGNLFYPAWDYGFEIIDMHPIKEVIK